MEKQKNQNKKIQDLFQKEKGRQTMRNDSKRNPDKHGEKDRGSAKKPPNTSPWLSAVTGGGEAKDSF